MNEKEVKEAAAAGGAVCSITGRRCKCDVRSGCANRNERLDRAPEEVVRWIAVAHIRLDGVREALLEAQDSAGGKRRLFPLPEARDWRRRIDELQREIESVLS